MTSDLPPGFDPNSVLYEFHQVGSYMRVAAVDPATGTEITIQGPASAGQALLMRQALNRLIYVLRKGQGGAS